MQSLKRGMKSLGLATGGFLRVAKILGRGGVFCSKDGWLGAPRLKELRKLEFWKGLDVGFPMFWPIVDWTGSGRSEGGLPDTLKRFVSVSVD